MVEAKFEVSIPRKDLAGFIVLFSLIEAGLIVMTFYATRQLTLLYAGFSAAFFILCCAVVLKILMFKVEVTGSTISVRTIIGRCYNIHISEITKIACETYYSKRQGKVGIVIIETANRKFNVKQTMNGFQEMAGYILEKLESGEINETNVSVHGKKTLIKCKSGKLVV